MDHVHLSATVQLLTKRVQSVLQRLETLRVAPQRRNGSLVCRDVAIELHHTWVDAGAPHAPRVGQRGHWDAPGGGSGAGQNSAHHCD
ncbi:MAG: hypothetical protein P8009_08900 [Gammaproteobacteria bacterium]